MKTDFDPEEAFIFIIWVLDNFMNGCVKKFKKFASLP